jgi:hypothetical protein
MPDTEIAIAVRHRARTRSMRSSSPTTNMYSASPSCAPAKRSGFDSAGKSAV